jgi:hypothetical protein
VQDKLDPWTKDEREYLGVELFGILNQVRDAIDKGELSDDSENFKKK